MSLSSDKGLLIPNLDKVQRANLANRNPASDLMVYDRKEKLFYFWNAEAKKWGVMNAWKLSYDPDKNDDISKAPIMVEDGHSVGIGTSGPPTATLEVNGTIKAASGIASAVELSAPVVNATTSIKTPSVTADNITIKNNITAGKFVGDGAVPTGGIIMWSGAILQIPTGWTLCDGRTVAGYKTPNLSGRFIVGYDNTVDDYSQPGKLGGKNVVEIQKENLPPHQHGYQIENSVLSGSKNMDVKFDKEDGGDNYSIFSNESSTTTGSERGLGIGGQALPFDNRPAYYVVAYIIKLP